MAEKRRNTGPTLPRNVEGKFQEMHIQYVWLELNARFGFELKQWQKKFNDYFERQPRTVSKTEAFYHFGTNQINPVINYILCRNETLSNF